MWLDACGAGVHDPLLSPRMDFCIAQTSPEALVAGGIALALALGGTAWVMRLAPRIGLLDIPNERSSHVRPTPRGGGIAIVLAVAAVMAGWLAWDAEPAAGWWGWAWWLGVLPVLVVSLWDDLSPLPAPVRLLVQVGAAALTLYLLEPALTVAAAECWTHQLELPGGNSLFFRFGVLAILLLWIVGLTNVYNFMDGIDGIAGLQAVVAGATLAVAGWWSGIASVAAVGAAIAGAALGFLWWNRPPARIFMGDVGSAFLGFTFAVLPLAAATRPIVGLPDRIATDLVAWLALTVAAVWPFLFDGIFTFLRRLRRGEDVLSSHRSHLYQRLVQAGASHGTVTALYGGYAAAGAVVGWVAWQRGQLPVWIAAAAVMVILALRLVTRVWGAEARAQR